jgi:hypothetical protein
LERLLDRYRDGALSEEDRVELERTLLSAPQARQRFWDHARFHALLARWGQEEWGRRMADGPLAAAPCQTARRPARRRWRRWLAAASAACLVLAALTLVGPRRDVAPSTDQPPATLAPGAAVLGASVDVEWEDAPGSAPGAVLEPGMLAIKSGALQVEFYSGARLVIQGPARVELRSEMEAFCHSGRLSAYVPAPARGFRVDAPGLSVVDLGTEFAMAVPPVGPPEVHVFTGAVELPPADRAQPLKLVAGEAVRLESATLKAIPADRRGFLGEAELMRLASGNDGRRQAVWRDAAATLDRDPATLAHFTFPREESASRTVANRATAAVPAAAPASIVGCGWADGRWPGHRAVELKGPGDRIRLDVPGQLHSVTLLAWVRIDALPNDYHALLAPDGLASGTLRWGLSKRGQLRLGIAKASERVEPNWEVVIGPAVVTRECFGQWIMLATTLDGKILRHFLNGEVIKSGEAYSPVPLVIGPAEVGNWRGPTPRFLQGRMDELAVLSRALSLGEIKAMYDAGRPTHSAMP